MRERERDRERSPPEMYKQKFGLEKASMHANRSWELRICSPRALHAFATESRSRSLICIIFTRARRRNGSYSALLPSVYVESIIQSSGSCETSTAPNSVLASPKSNTGPAESPPRSTGKRLSPDVPPIPPCM